MEIPHFIASWQSPESFNNKFHKFTRNLFPNANTYSGILRDIIANYGWNGFTILYEDNDSLVRLHDVLQNHEPQDDAVTVRRIPSNFDYRPLLKRFNKTRENRFIIDAGPEQTIEILRQGHAIGLFGEYYVSRPIKFREIIKLNR